jgi:ABC-type dipeptide/oligopeptide/nickel transport system permease component
MGAYIIRRLLLMIPTVFGIMAVSFLITQFAPGGPVEQALASMSGISGGIEERITGSSTGDFASAQAEGKSSGYRGSQGLPPELVARIEKQFGFDKPPLERFFSMIGNYLRFDFGQSYYRDISVIDLIREKMPVSISLGLWMTLIAYGISIPLGIAKARRDGSRFDVWTSTIIIIGYAVPGFLVAIALVVLFAGGSFWSIFPLRGLTSPGWANFPLWRQVLDYDPAHHRHGAGRLRHRHHADEELLPRRNRQAICGHRPRQGAERAAGALWSRIPQRNDVDHCGISRRVHWRILWWLAADRNHLLARWPGPSRLSIGRDARLSGGLCHALHLLPARPRHRAHLRPRLYVGRPAS